MTFKFFMENFHSLGILSVAFREILSFPNILFTIFVTTPPSQREFTEIRWLIRVLRVLNTIRSRTSRCLGVTIRRTSATILRQSCFCLVLAMEKYIPTSLFIILVTVVLIAPGIYRCDITCMTSYRYSRHNIPSIVHSVVHSP